MAYNYGPPPGVYGARQPAYAPPGAGINMPPSSNFGAPPGFDAPPGMLSQTPPNPMQGFQPPGNMPNINFNAPVIRLGVDGQLKGSAADRLTGGQGGGRGEGRGSNAEPLGNRNRLGLGASAGGDSRNLERDRAAVRENMMAMQPPTREEVARTIFVGGLMEGVPDDDAIENVLRCAGKLRRWTRAKDAEDKKCKFGFAEYEDVESLEAAAAIFVDGIEVPLLDKGMIVRDEDGEVKHARLMVVVDDQSKNYISEWTAKRKEDADSRQFRIDGCREDLRQTLGSITNMTAFNANAAINGQADEDVRMTDANAPMRPNGDVVTIPLTLEDELSDIPTEMRATVAEEIKAFRDRSNRRDIERVRREEELEQRERAAARMNRLASPPPPSGPASTVNGVPVGPRVVHGAPSGPKGFRGAQLPSDYVNGVAFVGANGATNGLHDEHDADESDEELERRRQEKSRAELERQYLDAERRWQNRARTRGAAQERERAREEAERRKEEREKEAFAKLFRDWNDDEEERKGDQEYYSDRSSWLRKRAAYREREQRDDDRDRAQEEKERVEERKKAADARGLADHFLDETSHELAQKAEEQPQGFKISLGSAAAKTKAAAATAPAPKSAMADVEGLLEDEEDAAASGLKRPELKPLTDTSTVPSRAQAQDLSDEERASLRQELASEIPTSASDLFAYPIKHDFLTQEVREKQIRPFVEKKVVEYLGVQEELLVEAVMQGLQERRKAEDLVEEVAEALEDESEVLIKKVWRLAVFWSEAEARGLS